MLNGFMQLAAIHQQETEEIKHYLVLAIVYEYPLTLDCFCCVLFHQDSL